MLAGAGNAGDGVCGEDLSLDAALVGAHGDGGGVDPAAANRRAYAGLVHGIASRPKSSPSLRQPSLLGAPRSRTPPNSRDAFAKALGAISLALYRQARYVYYILALISPPPSPPPVGHR